MDEIEILTERLGLKSSRKGLPMAASRARTNENASKFQNYRFSSSSASSELDFVLESGTNDADTLFDSCDERFSKEIDDFFRSFESKSEQKATIGGIFDDDLRDGARATADWASCDELMPGFGGSSRPNSPETQQNETGESCPLFSEVISEPDSSSKASSANAEEESSMEKTVEFVDAQINRWASGKQANLRALLSTLHHVVGEECSWKPVLMGDVLSSSSVNKFYKKAMLCVHPDKVQQRGANFQHMYTAQKLFHILKEAQNKFSREELA